MSVQAKAPSGQTIEIRRWRKNHTLMAWFAARSKARGQLETPDDYGFSTSILLGDVVELSAYAGDDDFARFKFLADLELDEWDLSIWRQALEDGFTLVFFAV